MTGLLDWKGIGLDHLVLDVEDSITGPDASALFSPCEIGHENTYYCWLVRGDG